MALLNQWLRTSFLSNMLHGILVMQIDLYLVNAMGVCFTWNSIHVHVHDQVTHYRDTKHYILAVYFTIVPFLWEWVLDGSIGYSCYSEFVYI